MLRIPLVLSALAAFITLSCGDEGLIEPKVNAATHYCPMTNWLNPIIDKVGLWSKLEFTLSLLGFNALKHE